MIQKSMYCVPFFELVMASKINFISKCSTLRSN